MTIFRELAHWPHRRPWGWGAIPLLCVACGGAPPADAKSAAAPPATESAAPAAAPPPASSAAPAAPASAAPAPVPAPTTEAPPPSEPVPARTLDDRLFAPTIAYMLNYSGSPAKEKVADACASKSGDDPAARAACVEKERAKLVSDVLVFAKKDKTVTFTVYKRTGSQLTEVGVAEVAIASDSPEKLELKVKSEKGNRQLFAGRKQIVIVSESDSSIALDDPQFGKLVYDARIGLLQ